MPSLRELRRKIKSVKSTQQITRAMKMVAAARMRKAQERILSARPFAYKMQSLLVDLAGRATNGGLSSGERENAPVHPLLEERSGKDSLVLLVTADKGLCGSFNANLLRKALEYLREHQGSKVSMLVVGRKGRDFLKRHGFPLEQEYLGIMSNLKYVHAELIGKDIIEYYLKHPVGKVVMIYNEFKSVLQQKLVVEQLLPIPRPGARQKEQAIDFLYEPQKPELLAELLPRHVKAQIYRVLLESYSSEMGARMTAMDNATKNAGDLIDHLILVTNKTRQSMITREILEVVSGAEALG